MTQARPRRFDGDRRERRSGSLLIAFAQLLVTCGGVILALYLFGFIPSFWPRQLNTPEDVQAAAANVEQVTTASIHKQQLATAKFNQNQLLAAFEEVKRTIDDWERGLAEWEQEGPPLLKSEAGKRIAADPEQLKRYRGVIQAIRPGKKDIATTRRAAEDLIKPVREALSNPQDASSPDAAITTALQGLQANAAKAKSGYRDAIDAAMSMLDAVKDKAPQEKTLEAAIAALDREEANSRAALIDAAVRKEKDDGASRIAQAKVALEKAIHDKEEGDIRLQAERKRLESQLAAAKAADERKVLERERERESVRLAELAEQKRQGDLRAGSVWKGTLLDRHVLYKNVTMTIISRMGDTVNGRIVYMMKGEEKPITYSATLRGNSLLLIPTDGAPTSDKYQCVYSPVDRTFIGDAGYISSFAFRLTQEAPGMAEE